MLNTSQAQKPNACIGVGLRHLHYNDALMHDQTAAPIDFVEIHAENFFSNGGITQALLQDISERYSLSVHGTSLGLGSHAPVPSDTLAQFSRLVKKVEPMLVSEHLCFNRAMVNNTMYHSGDLLPIAFNQASLVNTAANIQQVQDAIKRPLLIENLSAYITPNTVQEALKGEAVDKHNTPYIAQDTMDETAFLIALCERAGCGMLLDLNNLIVNALNQGHDSPVEKVMDHVRQLPPALVGEIHLAGFSEHQLAGFIVDDHGQAVSEQCWAVYEQTLEHISHAPCLVEWDTNLPAWQVLVEQATKARQCHHKHLRNA